MPEIDDIMQHHLGPEVDHGNLKARITPQSAMQACARLIGVEPVKVEYPGGLSRRSVRAVAAKTSYIVTRRRIPARGALEASVLDELRAAGAPVPAMLAYDGEWLIQEDLGEQRLTTVLGSGEARFAGTWAARALCGLLLCQRAAAKTSLTQRVARIGANPKWFASLMSMPERVAAQLGIPAPEMSSLLSPEQIEPINYSFVKWDARPGNALLVDSGGVGWVDWEHCGSRDPLDDLVWLLCDEYMPDNAALEAALLKRFLPLFALLSGRTPEDAQVYISRLGSLHTCLRLFLVLKHKGDGAWWDSRICEETDRVGVTLEAARRLCVRGARWSLRWPKGTRLHEFFSEAGKRLLSEDFDSSALLAGTHFPETRGRNSRPFALN